MAGLSLIDILFSNSTHVIDLAFYLGRMPKIMNCYAINNKLLLDENASRMYTGAGITDKDALFSYHSIWNAPGRWGVEMLTRKHRLIFRLLEQLHIQKLGSVEIEKIIIDDSLDIEFKPGIYREVKDFLSGDEKERFLNIHNQLAHCDTYELMKTGGCIVG